MKDLYVDRFLKCNMSQGVVRLDFARVENIDHEKNEVSMSPSARLILPMDSFLHFVEQVERMREKILSQDAVDTGSTIIETSDEQSDDQTKKKKTIKSVH
jgi:hypothetical protein